MASTTLVTFMLNLPHHAKRVELLGSWDNFRKPYAMRRDKDVSNTNWRGCFSFTDIVCDGDTLLSAEYKREGGLLMGGKYWYFFRLDDDMEHCNPTQPSTSACPLLPGQCVNVLEVPIQMTADGPSSEAALQPDCEAVFTLDPEDKYRVKPTAPSSSVPSKAPSATCPSQISRQLGVRGAEPEASKQAANGKLNADELQSVLHGSQPKSGDQTAEEQHQILLPRHDVHGSAGPARPKSEAGRHKSLPPSRQQSLRSAFYRLRRNRSTHTVKTKLDDAEVQMEQSESDTGSIHSYYTSEAIDHADFEGSETFKEPENEFYWRASVRADRARLPPDTLDSESSIVADTDDLKISDLITSLYHSSDAQPPAASQPLRGARPTAYGQTTCKRPDEFSWLRLDELSMSPTDHAPDSSLRQGQFVRANNQADASSFSQRKRKHLSLASSNRTSGVFSLDSQNDPITEPSSPAPRDSQPITPTVDGFFGSPFPSYRVSAATAVDPAPNINLHDTYDDRQDSHGRMLRDRDRERRMFLGYSLPAEEHASEQTLKAPEEKTRSASPSVVAGPNRGSPGGDGRSALQELVEDMGYLGAIIA